MNRRFYGAMVHATRNYFRLNCGALIALFAMGTLFAIFKNIFLTRTNVVSLSRTYATNCYLAIGVQLATVLAGIDLTGGALAALSGVMCIMTFEDFRLPIPMGITVGILVGTFVDLINSIIITYTGIHPFVVTLVMQPVCRRAAHLVASGSPVATKNTNFSAFGTDSLGVVLYPVTYMMMFLVMDYFSLDKLRTGRHIYAVGGNKLFARFSGIDVKKIKILVWTISGTIADFYGVVLAARLSSGQPSTEEGYETNAIVAAVLGGASFFGGAGTVGDSMIGVLIIGVVSSGPNLVHINSYWQFVLKGMIIIAAVYFDILKQKKQGASKWVLLINISGGFCNNGR